MRNTAVPLITVVALSYGGLLEGSVLTETVFAWPGLGAYLTGSLLNADMNAVLGATIVVGTVYIGLNLLSDLLYRLFDPTGAGVSAALPGYGTAAGWRRWLLTDTPASPLQARLGQAYSSWRALPRQPDGAGRPRHRAAAGNGGGPGTRAGAAVADRPGPLPPPAAALGRPLAGHRRAGPRHLLADRLGLAHHAHHRGPGRDHRRPGRPPSSARSRAMPAAGSTPC